MPQMNFTHFRGAVPRFQNYAAVAEQGVLFITPEANVLPRRYDPFEDSEIGRASCRERVYALV